MCSVLLCHHAPRPFIVSNATSPYNVCITWLKGACYDDFDGYGAGAGDV
jgi:hypothetical protein